MGRISARWSREVSAWRSSRAEKMGRGGCIPPRFPATIGEERGRPHGTTGQAAGFAGNALPTGGQGTDHQAAFRAISFVLSAEPVSAMIISDMILDKENDFSEIFSPKRFDLSLSIGNIANDMIETAKNFIAQKIYIPSSKIEHIKNGHAGIVEYNGDKIGVYKNNDGKEFIVSTKCPHLGCQLGLNADELTWDCPCHGSRFDYKGRLIGSPATKDLIDN